MISDRLKILTRRIRKYCLIGTPSQIPLAANGSYSRSLSIMMRKQNTECLLVQTNDNSSYRVYCFCSMRPHVYCTLILYCTWGIPVIPYSKSLISAFLSQIHYDSSCSAFLCASNSIHRREKYHWERTASTSRRTFLRIQHSAHRQRQSRSGAL